MAKRPPPLAKKLLEVLAPLGFTHKRGTSVARSSEWVAQSVGIGVYRRDTLQPYYCTVCLAAPDGLWALTVGGNLLVDKPHPEKNTAPLLAPTGPKAQRTGYVWVYSTTEQLERHLSGVAAGVRDLVVPWLKQTFSLEGYLAELRAQGAGPDVFLADVACAHLALGRLDEARAAASDCVAEIDRWIEKEPWRQQHPDARRAWMIELIAALDGGTSAQLADRWRTRSRSALKLS